MKYFYSLLFLASIFIYPSYSYGQNLIPNPGFELHDTCPTSFFQFELAQFWLSVENSPDFYNSCEPFHIVGVPYNYFGYQPAHSGCSYGGLFAAENNYREYMQTSLLSPLIPGTRYFISYNLSLGIGSGGHIVATNKFGCKLSTQSYTTANDSNPSTDNQATFYTDSIITDTLNWVTIKGSFIADSAYQFITFGNFFDSLQTQFIILTPNAPKITSYYYIDDVCLSTDSLTCNNVTDTCHPPTLNVVNEISKENNIQLFPNPFSEQLTIEMSKNEDYEVILYDITARQMVKEHFIKRISINTSRFSPGLYFYEVKSRAGFVKSGKIIRE